MRTAILWFRMQKMLCDIKFWTNDAVWSRILSDLGALRVNEKSSADLIFTQPSKKLNLVELQSFILENIQKNENKILERIAGENYKELTGSMRKLIIDLSRGPVAPYTNSHSLDTTVYNLRKIFGRDFIINEDGKYKLGK